MIRVHLVDLAQGRQRPLVLIVGDLQLSLSQQDGGLRLRHVLIGQLEPFIPALVGALQLSGARRHQIVDQRRPIALDALTQQTLALGPVALRQLNQPLGELVAAARCLALADRLAQAPWYAPQAHCDADQNIQRREHQEQSRHRHFHHVTAEIDQHVALILEQEMGGKSAEKQCCYDQQAQSHWRGST